MKLSGRKNKLEDRAKAKREDALSRLRDAKKQQERRIRVQFPNRDLVLREARHKVDAFLDEHRLLMGTVEAVFDEKGVELGYYLVVRDKNVDVEQLLADLRKDTGEIFELRRE